MRALRQLLQQELAALSIELDRISTDRPGMRDRLHRLRSSCGFCGATALADEVVTLQRQLADRPADQPLRLFPFRAMLDQTMAALAATAGPAA